MIAVFTPTTRPRVSTSGPPRVAGVERRRVLDDVLDQPAADAAHRAARGAHHAGGHRGAKAQRVAHGDHELADAQAVAVAEFGEGQVARGESHQRQIGVRVVADELGVEAVAFFGDGGQLAAGRWRRGCW